MIKKFRGFNTSIISSLKQMRSFIAEIKRNSEVFIAEFNITLVFFFQLNDVTAGGNTVFSQIGISVKPIKVKLPA